MSTEAVERSSIWVDEAWYEVPVWKKANKVNDSNPLEVVSENKKGSNALYAFLDF